MGDQLVITGVAVKFRVIINALAREDVPVVKAGRVGFQMPFADHRGLVPGLLEQLGEGGLGAVKTAVVIVVKAVDVAVRAGDERGAAGAAQRIVHQETVKPHAFPRQPVNVRGLNEVARFAIGADRLPGVVIREDEQDVGPTGGLAANGKTNRQRGADSERQQGALVTPCFHIMCFQ